MILFAACADPTTESVPVVVSDEEVFTSDPLESSLALEDIESIVVETMAESFYTPIDTYLWTGQLIEGVADDGDGCPSYEESEDAPGAWTSFWFGTCRGEAYDVTGDWQYMVQRTQPTADQEELFVLELHSVWGETIPGGDFFNAGGQLRIQWVTAPGFATMDMDYAGGYQQDGRTDALGDGVSGALAIRGDLTEEGFVGTLDGSIYGARASVEFVDLDYAIGCSSPTGTVLVRDTNSGWWTIELPDDCTGCGPASYSGEEYGEVCIGRVLHDSLDTRLAPYLEGVP